MTCVSFRFVMRSLCSQRIKRQLGDETCFCTSDLDLDTAFEQLLTSNNYRTINDNLITNLVTFESGKTRELTRSISTPLPDRGEPRQAIGTIRLFICHDPSDTESRYGCTLRFTAYCQYCHYNSQN